MRTVFCALALALAAVALSGCGSDDIKEEYPEKDSTGRWITPGEEGAVEGGIDLLGFGGDEISPENVIAVNRFLWLASLDVLSSLPLAFVDSYGGAIGTDWHVDPTEPDQRIKIVAVVRGLELQARSLSVTVHQQTKREDGIWASTEASTETARQIEDSILQRAREARIADTG